MEKPREPLSKKRKVIPSGLSFYVSGLAISLIGFLRCKILLPV